MEDNTRFAYPFTMGHLFDSYREHVDDTMVRITCAGDPDPAKVIYYMQENTCLRAGRAFYKNFYMYLQYNYLRSGPVPGTVHAETRRRLQLFVDGDFSIYIYRRSFVLKDFNANKVLTYELAHQL